CPDASASRPAASEYSCVESCSSTSAMSRSNAATRNASVPATVSSTARTTITNTVFMSPLHVPLRERPEHRHRQLQQRRYQPERHRCERIAGIARPLHAVLPHVDRAGRQTIDLAQRVHDRFLAVGHVETATGPLDDVLPDLVLLDPSESLFERG